MMTEDNRHFFACACQKGSSFEWICSISRKFRKALQRFVLLFLISFFINLIAAQLISSSSLVFFLESILFFFSYDFV